MEETDMYEFKEVLVYKGGIYIDPKVYDVIEPTPEFDKTFSTASKFTELTGINEYRGIVWAEAYTPGGIAKWREVWEDYLDRVKNCKPVT
jgi:hypothetical protein